MKQKSVLWVKQSPALFVFFVLDVATPHAEAHHSSVENILDVGLILFVNVLRRVQVKSVGVSGVEDDEDSAPAAAQNKYTSN